MSDTSSAPSIDALPMGIAMFTSAQCPYCVRAERFLAERGAIDIQKWRVDLDPALRSLMGQLAPGARTVPQIFIAGERIGGCDDLIALAQSHPERLDALLARAAASAL